jgi:ribose-phosphate pyrophosphokinase
LLRQSAPLSNCRHEIFPDSEQHLEICDSVRGRDVYVIQPTSPPVDSHLMELTLLGDAARRAGALRTTAVIPYFGYARQDRRASGREPVTARVVASFIEEYFDRVVSVDVHTSSFEALFRIPVEQLSAVTVLAESVRPLVSTRSVIVAPDLGAVKLAERYADILHAPVAVVRKRRITAEEVKTGGVVGDVAGRAPIIVDDMISTGGTIAAAIEALTDAGCEPGAIVPASHGLFVGPAAERLGASSDVTVTDSVSTPPDLEMTVRIASLAPSIADAIVRLHNEQSLGGLVAHV